MDKLIDKIMYKMGDALTVLAGIAFVSVSLLIAFLICFGTFYIYNATIGNISVWIWFWILWFVFVIIFGIIACCLMCAGISLFLILRK